MKKKILIGVGIFFAVMISLIITLIIRGRTTTPFSDSDLKLTRVTVPTNENAFFLLVEASEELSWPEGSLAPDLFDWNSWNKELADKILDENKLALELFDKALLLPQLQVPDIQDFEEDIEYFRSWKNLGQLSVLRSIVLFHEGKEKEALDLALRTAQFGHQIEGSEGTFMHYLIGSAVKQMSFKSMQKMISKSAEVCSSRELIARELDFLGANESALTNVIKKEYQLQVKYVEDTASGKTSGITNQTFPVAGIIRPVFNPTETRRLFATTARISLKSINPTFHDRPVNPVVMSTNHSVVKLFFSGNAVGKVLASLHAPSQGSFTSQKCKENVSVAATQLILALKCYREKYGSLPKSLEELVPEFIPKIPSDDFDGKPLRYSAEKKMVYSVGKDLIDSGGIEKDSGKNPLDIVFEFEF